MVAYDRIAFSFKAENIPSSISLALSIHPLTDIYASMNSTVQIYVFKTLFSNLLYKYPDVGLLDHMVVLLLIF